MANDFSKEERIAFEEIVAGFEDALVLSKNIATYRTDQTMMERTNDTIWRPSPYIMQSYDGTDMTANFGDVTQLSVPSRIGYEKSVPWLMTTLELRDALQEGRLGDRAKQKLASDINVAVQNVTALQGTLVVKRTTAAAGFDDVALCEAIMNEQGVDQMNRKLALSTRDYNGMASDLAGRETLSGKALTAYEKAFVGTVASFDTYKMDYAYRLAAAAGTATVNGANQYYTPAATQTAATGERENVDNRYQNLAITVGAGTVAVGDCFTIAGVNAVHHITKQDTGQLKTFRITALITGAGGTGTVQISPPIISGDGGTEAETMYQNVTATPAAGATITFLNTAAGYVNPFYVSDAFELLPGRHIVPVNAGAAVMKSSTENGIEISMEKFYDINIKKIKFRCDVRFGVTCLQPEMAGLILFSQT